MTLQIEFCPPHTYLCLPTHTYTQKTEYQGRCTDLYVNYYLWLIISYCRTWSICIHYSDVAVIKHNEEGNSEKRFYFTYVFRSLRVHNGRGGMEAEVARAESQAITSSTRHRKHRGTESGDCLPQWHDSSNLSKHPEGSWPAPNSPQTGIYVFKYLKPVDDTHLNHHSIFNFFQNWCNHRCW